MKICSLCGKEFEGWGNNPWPLCDNEDYDSTCCDDCNSNLVITARMLQLNAKKKDPEIGDKIIIFYLSKGERKIDLKIHEILDIDEKGDISGTWGNFTINADKDSFIILD